MEGGNSIMENGEPEKNNGSITKKNNDHVVYQRENKKKTGKSFKIDTALISLLTTAGMSGLLLSSFFPKRIAFRWLLKNIHVISGLSFAGLATYHCLLHKDWYIKNVRKITDKS
jgi:hypothetical protein